MSLNGGGHWVSLKNDMPTVPIHDIVIHPRENDLVLGTHGRGFFILDDITILEELTPTVLDSGLHLASLRPATQLHTHVRGRNFQGHTYFAAPNPPRGAFISYFIDPALLEAEQGSDAVEGARIRLRILDSEEQLIRNLEVKRGQPGGGLQRVVWDLRHERPFLSNPEADTGFLRNALPGAFVMPGEYRVSLEVGKREVRQSLLVRQDPAIQISPLDRRLWHDTLVTLSGLLEPLRAVLANLDRVSNDIETVRESLTEQPEVPASLEVGVAKFEAALQDLRTTLLGDQNQGQAVQPGAPALADRVRRLYTAIEASTAAHATQ